MMNIISIIIGAVLVNNLLLTHYIGINPAIASSKTGESAISMGLSIMLTMTISTIITKLINDYLLVPFNLEFLQMLAYVITIVLVLKVYYEVNKKKFNKTVESLDAFMPLLVINNLFLGVALLVVNNNLNLVETIIYSIGTSLGFLLVTLLLSSINYKYRFIDMPRHFKEKPITIMALGLIALAFYGFVGLV